MNIKKKIISTLVIALASTTMGLTTATAQGWPASYGGVMLQGFYWDSYSASSWTNLTSQADEISSFFDLMWVPQSGNCGSDQSMGYDDLYWFDHNSSFGTVADLRTMISTYKAKGTGIIADVVINHRKGFTTWNDFPSETYSGTTYQLTSADICSTDECVAAGYAATGAADTGDDFDGLRDLDHTSANVQANVNAYLGFLKNDLGYEGFRYDMVKGFYGSYVGSYNATAAPTYSVGEYFDGSYDLVSAWIDSTARANGTIQSAAFDFPGKFAINDACNNGNWASLMWRRNYTTPQPAGLIHMDTYQRYAITFVDNHDTYRDDNSVTQNVMAGNAFILTMPGTPCVFLPHWQAYKSEIKKLITARKTAGITNQSTTTVLASSSTLYAASVTGTNGTLYMKVGTGDYSPTAAATLVTSGDNYAVWLATDNNTVWSSLASGEYSSGTKVGLTAITTATDAAIYYTTDGTAPSAANGTLIASGDSITLTDSITLRAALVTSTGTVSEISRTYTIKEAFAATTATVYVKADWTNMYYYAWDSSGSSLLAGWPGTRITATTTVNGSTWYYHTFDITSEDYSVNLVFNQGSSSAQTVDVTGITSDRYYEISSAAGSDGKYTVTDVTTLTGISSATASSASASSLSVSGGVGSITYSATTPTDFIVSSLSGQVLYRGTADTMVQTISGLLPGIYIVGRTKVVVR